MTFLKRILGGGVALFLVWGCDDPVAPEPEGVVEGSRHPNPVQALASAYRLSRPTADSLSPEVILRVYDKRGRVTASHVVPRAMARSLWRELRPAAQGIRNGSTQPQLPSPGWTSPAHQPSFAPAATFADTTVSFEIEGVEHTIQSARTATELVVVGATTTESPYTADWATYSVSGDTTIVSSVTNQQYDGGLLHLEVYFSPAAIASLNEELNAPETSPPMPVSEECVMASLYAGWKLGEAAAATFTFLKLPSLTTFGWMWAKRAQAVSGFLLHLCVCWDRCAAMAPQPRPAWQLP